MNPEPRPEQVHWIQGLFPNLQSLSLSFHQMSDGQLLAFQEH